MAGFKFPRCGFGAVSLRPLRLRALADIFVSVLCDSMRFCESWPIGRSVGPSSLRHVASKLSLHGRVGV